MSSGFGRFCTGSENRKLCGIHQPSFAPGSSLRWMPQNRRPIRLVMIAPISLSESVSIPGMMSPLSQVVLCSMFRWIVRPCAISCRWIISR
ncbi:hypothetical protein DP44_5284 [Burkholderia pseudomallei]|nr:hypothetical protein DP44_5284 [Burkholderia pseudomallei]